ncbi:MAG: two-component regulator propeller domain-containing protein [Cyclobacteriaceae bacterium]
MRSFIKGIERAALLIMLIVHAISASAQIYPATFYSTIDGLPSNSVFGITQDNKGIMWFLTSKGVVSYDGQNWEKSADYLRLPHSSNSYIKTLDDGSIWAAGQDNEGFVLSYKKGQKWSEIRIPEQADDITSTFAFEAAIKDGEYMVWIADYKNLYCYSGQTDSWEITPITIRINSLLSYEEKVYVCSNQGLFHFSEGTIEPVHPEGSFLNDTVLTMTIKNGKFYILGFDWISILENNKTIGYWDHLNMTGRPLFNRYSLVVDDRERIFYICDSPILQFDPETGKSEVLETNDKIHSAKSAMIYKDFENNIWVGGHRGLFRFNQLRFSNYDRSVGLYEDEVSAIIQLKNGQIILANREAVNMVENGKVTKSLRLPHSGGKLCRILDMVEDKNGALYLALGPAGLVKYENGKFVMLRDSDKPDLDFSSIEVWRDKIYTASTEGGIYEITKKGLKKTSGLRGVRNLRNLNDEYMVACAFRGIFKMSQQDTVHIKNGLRDIDDVFDVIIWNDTLLAGTLEGLMVVKDGVITSENILKMDLPVYSLMQDQSNNLWVGTGDGIVKGDGKTFMKYNRSNGFVGSEVNRGALIQDKKGKVWIGTESGASAYNEEEDPTLDLAPKLTIPFIKDGKGNRLDANQSNEIPYDRNTIEISFRGISFIDEKGISYRYKLEGIDADWRVQNNNINTSARYTTLKSGTYTFTVQSRLEQRRWSDPVSATFLIEKPFYSEVWFVVLMVLLLVGVFLAIYQLRFFYLIRRQQYLKKLIRARTQEITTLNKSLEQKVKIRTSELEERNKRLSEYAFINAHLLRAPLNRIQSLAILMEETKAMEDLYLDILKESTSELDEVIFSINSTLREEKKE